MGGEFLDHYRVAYKTLTEQRAAFGDMSSTLRKGADAALQATLQAGP